MTPVFSGRTKLAISLAKYSFALRCAAWMYFLCHATKKVRKKTRQGVPPWNPPSVPLCKAEQEKNISFYRHRAPHSHHERQIWKAKSFVGSQRALGPLADFLSSFLCSGTKKGSYALRAALWRACPATQALKTKGLSL